MAAVRTPMRHGARIIQSEVRVSRPSSSSRHAGAELLLFGVPGERQLDEAIEQRAVAEAGGLPQLRVHADGRESGDRVHLVDVYRSIAPRHEEVDPGHARAVDRLERFDRQTPNLPERGG